ncbi:MAG TPA: serine/threonine-protein kinase, partial [Solirubrobacterales bacterium]|nr:serine/threonine-protein kinase [Solirubrobacterales bacterium]
MTERELLLGVLATQVGLVTPAQVMAAASAHFSVRDGRSLLDHLVDAGALTPEKGRALQELADQALSTEPVTIVQDDRGQTIDPSASTPPAEISDAASGDGEASNLFEVPFERPEQYRRLDELGRGGQSVVWRALDRLVGREVAMKELTGPGEASIHRFLREARLVASLDHPGIVPVLELVRRADGTLVCVQKLVVGETLKARFASCRGLEDRLQLLPHLIAACQAVGYAHAHRVVHRDLKPSNIMVGPFGQTVVVDWGLAKRIGAAEPEISGPEIVRKDLTVVGAALGTPAYMSPEQARGEVNAIDERTDVFNLGAVLF